MKDAFAKGGVERSIDEQRADKNTGGRALGHSTAPPRQYQHQRQERILDHQPHDPALGASGASTWLASAFRERRIMLVCFAHGRPRTIVLIRGECV